MCLNQLSLLLSQQTAPRDTAAILIEPLLGEGGYIHAPGEFLKGVRELCDKHNILLIIDEVQSGFGRTGKMFNVEYSGVRPDIMTIAKGLANGFPLSGVVSKKEYTDKLKPGSMGGTYAGNAVACAAAVAVADAFKEEKILENVQARYALTPPPLHEQPFLTFPQLPGTVQESERTEVQGSPQARHPRRARPGSHGCRRVCLADRLGPLRRLRRQVRAREARGAHCEALPREGPAHSYDERVRGHPVHPAAERQQGRHAEGHPDLCRGS